MKYLAALVASAAVLSTAATASAHELTVRGDHRIGSFYVKRDGTLRGAIDAFGRPSSKTGSGDSCTARWGRHGLKILFYNLGGQDACRPAHGHFGTARLRGDHWTTNHGLDIGHTVRRLRNLYPRAEWHRSEPGFWPAGWWLKKARSPFGDGSAYPGLLAKMKDGRVAAFHVRYPAGGD